MSLLNSAAALFRRLRRALWRPNLRGRTEPSSHHPESESAVERRYRDIFENAYDMVYTYDLRGRFTSINRAAKRITGYSQEEALRMNIEHIVAPDHLDRTRQMIALKLQGQETTTNYESDIITKDGRRVTVEVSSWVIYENGQPAAIQGIARDVTERKRLEARDAAFTTLGQKLSLATNAQEAAWIVVDIADKLLGWDACYMHLLAPESGKVIPVLNYDIINGQRASVPWTRTDRRTAPMDQRVIEHGAQLILRAELSQKVPGLVAFGDQNRPSASLMFVPMRNGNKVIGTLSIQSYSPQAYDPDALNVLQALADFCAGAMERIQDLTERLHLETQLRHAQKLEAVGRLAAGIAHDFNNIMTVIQGYASYQLSTAQPDGELAESLRQISEAAERAAGLTRQLLAFSRKQILHLRSLNLNETIRQVTRTLSRVLGEDILLECHLEAELPSVWADVGMIEQLITNLAVNARDAMPHGGRFVVRTASVEVEADAASVHAEARPGSFVCLSIADTGSGMDAVTLSRIFEPFFTTKDVGQGSGLGLATVHGIVKQHQGWIDTSSQTGRGTTFKIFLPIARQPAEEHPPISHPAAHPADSKIILVVEDETSVRRFVCHLLRQEGFQLAEVASGVDALQWWKENGRNADLLLTDIMMPGGVSGRQLAEQLRSEKPGLKVILTSGYSLETTERDGILEKGFHFLAKPYPPAHLIELVRCCLDSDGQ